MTRSNEAGDQSSVALSFSGCGFLGVYQIGVAQCLIKHSQKTLLCRVDRYAGASAGSLIAAVVATCPHRIEEVFTAFFELSNEINDLTFGAMTSGFSLIQRLEQMIDDILPVDAHSLAYGKAHISMTKKTDRTNYVASNFETRADFINHLLASCYIPVYAGPSEDCPLINGVEYEDGGMTNNLPKFDDVETITVSPFSGEADISPDDTNVFDWTMTLFNQCFSVNFSNVVRGCQALFPPDSDVLISYHRLGYMNAMRYLKRHNLFEPENGSEV